MPTLPFSFRLAPLALAALVLGGCATVGQVNHEVATYSQWPAERKPASYVFERLPSQQARPQAQQVLEQAAAPALAAAGFSPVAQAEAADYSVQLGARVTGSEIYQDNWPYWRPGGFHGPFGPYAGHGRAYWGGGWGWGGLGYGGMRYGNDVYEREVVLLVRDRRSGQQVYEARASNVGYTRSIESLLPSMFQAAMTDFPHGGPNPRQVSLPVAPRTSP